MKIVSTAVCSTCSVRKMNFCCNVAFTLAVALASLKSFFLLLLMFLMVEYQGFSVVMKDSKTI